MMSYIFALLLHIKLSLDCYAENAAQKSEKPGPFFVPSNPRDRAIYGPLALALLVHFVFFFCSEGGIIEHWVAFLGMGIAVLAVVPALYVGVKATMLTLEHDAADRARRRG